MQPLLEKGMTIPTFWIAAAIISLVPAVLFLFVIPKHEKGDAHSRGEQPMSLIEPFKIIFKNPQSWLTGIISGLLFAPTTLFIMTWAVRFFKQDLKYDAGEAALAAGMASVGWAVGAPLFGYISDKIGKRKPILMLGCIGIILMFLQIIYLPNLMAMKFSILLMGFFSGVAMIPYSSIKEVNPDNVKGSATGVQNFITVGVTSVVGPIFANMLGDNVGKVNDLLGHFNHAVWFWIIIVAIALGLSFLLKETGHKFIEAKK